MSAPTPGMGLILVRRAGRLEAAHVFTLPSSLPRPEGARPCICTSGGRDHPLASLPALPRRRVGALMRAAASLLFASAYLVTLLLAPRYDAASLPHGLRLLFAACGLCLFASFLAFALSFRPKAPRPLTAPGDDHAE